MNHGVRQRLGPDGLGRCRHIFEIHTYNTNRGGGGIAILSFTEPLDYPCPAYEPHPGITARFFRPPMGLTDRGCSYAVRIAEGYLPTAMERLRAEGLLPMRVFYAGADGSFSEVSI